MTKNSKFINQEVKPLIVSLRRHINQEENWLKFQQLIEDNIDSICAELDTRWLVSVADTYVDYGSEIEKRNALYISMIVNFEKFWATNLLMYDLKLNKHRLNKLKNNTTIPLWDGMFSFNINRGDMSRNLFGRLQKHMEDTPVLEKILTVILKRISDNNTVLGNLSKYHKRLMIPAKKRSIVKGLIMKMRQLFKNYRLINF